MHLTEQFFHDFFQCFRSPHISGEDDIGHSRETAFRSGEPYRDAGLYLSEDKSFSDMKSYGPHIAGCDAAFREDKGGLHRQQRYHGGECLGNPDGEGEKVFLTESFRRQKFPAGVDQYCRAGSDQFFCPGKDPPGLTLKPAFFKIGADTEFQRLKRQMSVQQLLSVVFLTWDPMIISPPFRESSGRRSCRVRSGLSEIPPITFGRAAAQRAR